MKCFSTIGKPTPFQWVVVIVASLCISGAFAAELHIGAAAISITPDQPVAVAGQIRTRIARTVESEVTAQALAIESREQGKSLEQSLLIACDLLAIRGDIHQRVREGLTQRIPDFDGTKLILSATHTHTAPVMTEGIYKIPEEGVMQPAAYAEFLIKQLIEVAVQAWDNRQEGAVAWGMGNAVVGYNRRSYFEDGHAQMYGDITVPGFRGIEGPGDPGVEILYFWAKDQKLIATAINVVCPSQEVESRSTVNADFWHPVRESLKEKYGKELVVLGWAGAAGDQSPHIRYRQAAEDRMRELRKLDRLDEIARRIVNAWEEAYTGASQDIRKEAPFIHNVKTIHLPLRPVTEAEVAYAKSEMEKVADQPDLYRAYVWHEAVLKRYATQEAGTTKPYEMELHTLRIGDIAIATNDFELFSQYGIQMKARSKALQTFIIQLAGPGTYIPTPHAAAGEGYSAIVQSNDVGALGGQVLTDTTIDAVNALWTD